MKLKFNIANGILLLSQSLLILALTSCGGNSQNSAKSDSSAAAAAKVATTPLCNDTLDLDVSGHVVEIKQYFDQAKAFVDTFGYLDKGKKVNFSDVQFENVNYNSIIAVIDSAKTIIQDPQCRIVGLRIFSTLDIVNKKIKLYYTVDHTESHVSTSQSGNYTLDFFYKYENIEEYIDSSNVAIYESVNLELVDIRISPEKIDSARKYWSDYKRLIQIQQLSSNPSVRGYEDKRDVTSVFFPDEEFYALKTSDEGISAVKVVSEAITLSTNNRHSIVLGNIRPPVIKKNKFNFEKYIDGLTPAEIASYRGMSGNLGQLCPSKCKQLNVKYDASKKQYSIIDK